MYSRDLVVVHSPVCVSGVALLLLRREGADDCALSLSEIFEHPLKDLAATPLFLGGDSSQEQEPQVGGDANRK